MTDGYIYRPEDYPFGGYPGPTGVPTPASGADRSPVDTLPVTGVGPRPAPWLPPLGYVPPDERHRPDRFARPDTPRGEPARVTDRVLAKIIDTAIVGLPLGLIYVWANRNGHSAVATVMSVVIVAATIGYETYFISRRGATIGKRARGIVVVDEASGERLNVGKAFYRSLILYVINNFLLLAGLWTLLLDRPKRRGWQDKAAGDVVVVARTAVPPVPGKCPGRPIR